MNIRSNLSSRPIPGRPRRGSPLLLIAIVALVVGGCDRLLDVDLPGNISAETLNDPSFASLLALGAQGDFECAFNNFVWSSGLWTNDFHPANITRTNNILHQRQEAVRTLSSLGSAGNQPNCRQTNPPPIYMPLHTARAQAQTAIDFISGFADADVPRKAFLIGASQAYKGYSTLLLAESHCELTFDAGPIVSREAGFDTAMVALSSAITALGGVVGSDAAEATSIMTMAKIGRARVALNLGDHAQVLMDLAGIPEGFIRYADRQDVSAQTRNLVWDQSRNDGISVTESYYEVGTENGLSVGGVIDPRVPVRHTGLGVGADGLTDVWQERKYTSRGKSIPLATWREAQLMIAEADRSQIVSVINLLRNNPAGVDTEIDTSAWPLPPYVGGTDDENWAALLEERRRELWMQGTRLGDMLRTGQPFRAGQTPKGEPYGPLTCMPLQDRERQANTNIEGG